MTTTASNEVTKCCSRCKKDLPTDQFYPRRLRSGRGWGVSSVCRSCDRQYKRDRRAGKISVQKMERLPPEPFRQWILDKMQSCGLTLQDIGLRAGITERSLRRVVNREQIHVTLQVVDQTLTAWDDHLMFLYPEMYE